LVVVLLWFRVRFGLGVGFAFVVLLLLWLRLGWRLGLRGLVWRTGGLGVCEARDHMGNRLGEGTGVGAHGWFCFFYVCFT